MDFNDPKYKAACDEAFRMFPDEVEPVDYPPLSKIIIDRENLRYAFIQGWYYANKTP